MKQLVFVFMLFPLVLCAQYDFDTRYFTIDAASLPDVPEINSFEMNLGPIKNFEIKSLSDFNKVTAVNYWEAVDMASAIEKKENFKRADYDSKLLRQKLSTYGGTSGYSKDGSSKVVNTVYKEQRGLDFMDPCPPFGICPRCAPYRVGRGF